MKEFFTKIGTFFRGIIDRCRNDRKFMYICAGSAAAFIIVLVLIIVLCVNGSRKSGEPAAGITPSTVMTPTPIPTPTPVPTPTPEPTPTPDLHIGEVRSELDGSWISEEAAANRPFAAMLNNIIYANPQSGVGDAKILYEALTEGGITRLMGIYEGIDADSPSAERLGSIRSARHYFVSIASEYDAIYIHWGGAYYAYDKLTELGIKDDLDGMYLGSGVFYRDNDLTAPHNGFFSFNAAYDYLKEHERRTTHGEDYAPNHFTFNDEALYPADGSRVFDEEGNIIIPSAADVMPAEKIVLSYDRWTQPYMVYNAEEGLYYRYQFGGQHIDYNTGEPLTFTNIIIQIVREWDKDRNDYQDMDIEDSTGKGYYISYGQCVPITWEKNEKARTMSYYDAEGQLLSINPGKTFISVYPDFREEQLSIGLEENE